MRISQLTITMKECTLGQQILAAIGANPAHAMLQISVDVDGFTSFASSPTGSLTVPALTHKRGSRFGVRYPKEFWNACPPAQASSLTSSLPVTTAAVETRVSP